jgi:hypothetical protein
MSPSTRAAAVKKGAPRTYSNRVGGIRPSQLMHTFGVGAMVDLPNFAVVIAGLDDWKMDYASDLVEERLLAAIRADKTLGLPGIKQLRAAPWLEETRNPFEEWARTGVPVLPFPRWMRCSACSLLTTIDAGLLELTQNPWRPDQTRYVHKNCSRARGKPPTAVPARFVVACSNGHLDEFPWVEFVHRGTGGFCPKVNWRLQARDIGSGSRSTDMMVECVACDAKTVMTAAFGENADRVLPLCRGRHPHIRYFGSGCGKQVRPLLLGASNAWFAVTRAVLSIPASSDIAEQAVAEVWAVINDEGDPIDSEDLLRRYIRRVPELKRLAAFDVAKLWEIIEARRAGAGEEAGEPDVLGPEWERFVNPHAAGESRDFRLGQVATPPGFGSVVVVPVERLRSVVALCGFTRIDGPDSGVASDVEGLVTMAPLARNQPNWLPAAEVRGEGIFVRIDEGRLQQWLDKVSGSEQTEALRAAHQEWRRQRGHADVNARWPGERYVLVHTLAHLLVHELALECGYSTASIRERIYARDPDQDGKGAMAGVLLYTSAPDSEGTLGGLVALAQPDEFSRILGATLERAQLCSADPLCAGHCPSGTDVVLHGAACHSCSFLPETSCERGNRYLDRSVVVGTLADVGIEFGFGA